jgi:hypothetical protein
MPQDDDAFEPDENESSEYVPAVIARSMEEAERYRELLDDHDIPAIIGADEAEEEQRRRRSSRRKGISRGVPVLVPEALLDEASEIIADREEGDEFQEVAEDVEQAEDDEEDVDLDLAAGFELEEDDEDEVGEDLIEGDFEGDEDEEPDEDEDLEDEERP